MGADSIDSVPWAAALPGASAIPQAAATFWAKRSRGRRRPHAWRRPHGRRRRQGGGASVGGCDRIGDPVGCGKPVVAAVPWAATIPQDVPSNGRERSHGVGHGVGDPIDGVQRQVLARPLPRMRQAARKSHIIVGSFDFGYSREELFWPEVKVVTGAMVAFLMVALLGLDERMDRLVAMALSGFREVAPATLGMSGVPAPGEVLLTDGLSGNTARISKRKRRNIRPKLASRGSDLGRHRSHRHPLTPTFCPAAPNFLCGPSFPGAQLFCNPFMAQCCARMCAWWLARCVRVCCLRACLRHARCVGVLGSASRESMRSGLASVFRISRLGAPRAWARAHSSRFWQGGAVTAKNCLLLAQERVGHIRGDLGSGLSGRPVRPDPERDLPSLAVGRAGELGVRLGAPGCRFPRDSCETRFGPKSRPNRNCAGVRCKLLCQSGLV